MFVWYAGRRFDIKGVYDPDGKRRRTHIACVSKRK
jgi:head-tail adaptor